MNFLDGIKNEAVEWCRGKNWWIRLPLILFFVYVLIRHLQNPQYKSIIGALNLGFHEMGHLIFMPFGEFIYILGGSLTQCVIPILGMLNFYRQKDFFAIALCFGWLSTNIFEVATYVGDAKDRALNLVGFGVEPPMHDWYYLLKKLNLLEQCRTLEGLLQLTAVISMVICIFLGLWLIWIMFKSRKEPG